LHTGAEQTRSLRRSTAEVNRADRSADAEIRALHFNETNSLSVAVGQRTETAPAKTQPTFADAGVKIRKNPSRSMFARSCTTGWLGQ
jgi:hypothetical protein